MVMGERLDPLQVELVDATSSAEGGGPLVRWLRRRDPVTWVLGLHGLALLGLDRVVRPVLGWWVVALFVGWRVALGAGERRARGAAQRRLGLVREAGSLLAAAGMMTADGGTESPFFFWMLILLAWQALRFRTRHLMLLSGAALVAYLGVVLIVPDLTPTSLGRLVLFATFCGVLVLGRRNLDRQQERSGRLERLFHDTLSAEPVATVLLAGQPLRVVVHNQAADRSGLTSALADADPDLWDLVHRAADSGRDSEPTVVEMAGSGGERRWLRVVVAPRLLDGDRRAVIVCAEDVTDQVMVGEQRRRFLQLAGHQLRTPLTPIIAYGQMLKTGAIRPDEVGDAADQIVEAGRQLERLFERIGTVTSLHGEVDRPVQAMPVGDLIRRLDSAHPHILDGVDVEGDPEAPVVCHPESVVTALSELLDNAHTHGKPPARLSWETVGEFTELRVTDAGPGPRLSEEELFGQWGDYGVDLMPPGMGTRLGLLHARILTELTGGTLQLKRSADAWAFILTLPSRRPAG